MVDIFIFGGLIIGAVLGFRDGFFRKLYSILGFLGGICASLLLYEFLGELIASWLDFSVPIARVFAFTIIFIIFVVALNMVYRWTGSDKSKTMAVWSRSLGGAIGIFQAALVVSLLLMVGNKIGMIDEPMKKDSIAYSSLIDFAPDVMTTTMTWLPKAQVFIKELKEKL